MKEYKLFAQRLGIVGITHILVGLSGLVFLPIITNNLSISNYGVWVQFTTSVSLLYLLGILGLPFTMVRFLAAEKDKDKIQEVFYSITFIVIIASLILAFVLFLFAEPLSKLLFDGNIVVGMILPFAVFLYCLNNILINYFRTFQQIKKFSIFTILQTYINVTVVSLLLIFNYGLTGAVLGFLLTQIILFIFTLPFIISDIGFKFPKFKNMKEYLSFGIPTIPSSLSYWVVNLSDRFVIGILLGAVFVGYYSPGYTLGNIVIMLSYPFSLMLPAVLSKYYDENNHDGVNKVLQYSLKYYLVIAIPSVVGLSLLSKTLLYILSTPEIASNGYLVTPFVALGGLFSGIYTIISQVLIIKKNTKIIGIIWIIAAVLNLVLNLIFVPYFGIVGAAIITLITFIISLIFTLHYSRGYFNLGVEWKFIAKAVFASLLLSLIIILVNPTGILSTLIVIGICIPVYLASLWILKGFEKKEIEFFKSMLKKTE